MKDVRLMELAARQHNRVAHAQLRAAGYSDEAIRHRVAIGRLVVVEHGVYGVAPLLDDPFGAWMAATLTTPESFLSHASAGAADGFWPFPRAFETVTRPGNRGPRRHGGILVFCSRTLAGDTTMLGPIPITTPERTLLDLAAARAVSDKTLARAVRDAVRLERTTLERLADYLRARPGRRGAARLLRVLATYSRLPIARARSGAEVRALVLLRDAGLEVPALNDRIRGEEADLSWRALRLIVELDGAPFHLDLGEDARKEAVWRSAGWKVLRLSTDDVYERPERLLSLATAANVPPAGS